MIILFFAKVDKCVIWTSSFWTFRQYLISLSLSLQEWKMVSQVVTLTSGFVDKNLWCDQSNKTSLVVLSHRDVFYSGSTKTKFGNSIEFDLNHFGCDWAQTFTHQAEYGEHEHSQYIANQRGGKYEGQAVDKWQHTETKEYLRTTIKTNSVKNFSEV